VDTNKAPPEWDSHWELIETPWQREDVIGRFDVVKSYIPGDFNVYDIGIHEGGRDHYWLQGSRVVSHYW